jgi:hypothetical protein
MFTHPDLLAIVAKQHVNEMIEEASKHNLATALRRSRRQRGPDSRRPAGKAGHVRPAGKLA